jgi:hypothetical protein
LEANETLPQVIERRWIGTATGGSRELITVNPGAAYIRALGRKQNRRDRDESIDAYVRWRAGAGPQSYIHLDRQTQRLINEHHLAVNGPNVWTQQYRQRMMEKGARERTHHIAMIHPYGARDGTLQDAAIALRRAMMRELPTAIEDAVESFMHAAAEAGSPEGIQSAVADQVLAKCGDSGLRGKYFDQDMFKHYEAIKEAERAVKSRRRQMNKNAEILVEEFKKRWG